MNTYIVLFRGVNVAGKNILPMKDLARILEENHFKNVQTYIQSGNVVLQSTKNPSSQINSIVQNKFSFKPEILVIGESEFISLINNNPFISKEGKTMHFYFCKSSPKVNEEKLKKLKAKSEEYHIEGNILYLYAPEGIGRSKLVVNIESCLGVPATGRNLNTVSKIQSMLKNS